MRFFIPVIAAIAFFSPAVVEGWNLRGAHFGSDDYYDLLTLPQSIVQRQKAMMDRFDNLKKSYGSPQYEIADNDKEYQVAIDVPGLDTKNINITLEENTRYLTISGKRDSNNEGYSFKSEFSQSFSLGDVVDVGKLSATLNDGVLVVSAPKDNELIKAKVRNIPISKMISDGNGGSEKWGKLMPALTEEAETEAGMINLDAQRNGVEDYTKRELL